MKYLFAFVSLIQTLLPIYGYSAGPAPHLIQGPQVPSHWYELPEDSGNLLTSSQRIQVETETVSQTLEKIYSVTAQSMDAIPPPSRSSQRGRTGYPVDWVPWHLEAFTTDLTVTTQGLLGLLTIRGTPSVQVFWRKQGIPRRSPLTPNPDIANPPSIQLNEESTPEQINDQIEPAIRAILASRKVRNSETLRRNLQSTAVQFQEVLAAVDQNKKSSWWLSGFRFDFGVEASGNIAPIYTAGGDLRLRFEWKRLSRRPIPSVRGTQLNPMFAKMKSSFKELVSFMEGNLEGMAQEYLGGSGFVPYAFRVGIGMTAAGDIALARAAGSIVGHLNFSKDVQKPVIHLPPTPANVLNLTTPSTALMVEHQPSQAHLDFANSEHIPTKIMFLRNDSQQKLAVYQIQAERFKKGLSKAFKIASSFAGPGTKVKSSKWKIYEMRTGFELSISGDIGLVNLNGFALAEVLLYNKNF